MESNECRIVRLLNEVLTVIRTGKPDERSEVARRYAVTITELEKVIGYFETWVVREQETD